MSTHSVFISFKNTFDGKPTADAKIAEELYTQLTQCGIDTFYSNDTIKSLGASEYKQAINNALDNASVLILIGSRLDFIQEETSPWVYYEWEKFHSEYIYNRKQKVIVPYLSESISRKEKPFELRDIQTFTLEKNSIDDVLVFVINSLAAQKRKETKLVDNVVTQSKQQSHVISDEVKSTNKVADTEVLPTDKTAKRLKSAKIAAWVNIAIVSLTVLVDLILCLADESTLITFGLTILVFSTVICYPSVSVLIHYGRKLRLVPKALNVVLITLLCMPIMAIIMAFFHTDEAWFYVVLLIPILAPSVAFLGSIAYSAIVLRKKPSDIKS